MSTSTSRSTTGVFATSGLSPLAATAGVAGKAGEGASKAVEGAQKGVEGAEKATEGLQKGAEGLQQGGNQPKVDLSDKDCWVVNGVPQMGILPQPPDAYS